MPESLTIYQSYLLRLWQEDGHAMWHCSAQSIQTKEVTHFADLDSLFTYLAAQTTSTRSADRRLRRKDDLYAK